MALTKSAIYSNKSIEILHHHNHIGFYFFTETNFPRSHLPQTSCPINSLGKRFSMKELKRLAKRILILSSYCPNMSQGTDSIKSWDTTSVEWRRCMNRENPTVCFSKERTTLGFDKKEVCLIMNTTLQWTNYAQQGFNYFTKWKKINQRVLLLTNNNIVGLEIAADRGWFQHNYIVRRSSIIHLLFQLEGLSWSVFVPQRKASTFWKRLNQAALPPVLWLHRSLLLVCPYYGRTKQIWP